MAFLKLLTYIGGIGSVIAVTTTGYILSNSNSSNTNIEKSEDNNNLDSKALKTQDSDVTKLEKNAESSKELSQATEEVKDQNQLDLSKKEGETSSEGEKQNFEGWLIFTTSDDKVGIKGSASKLGGSHHYKVKLLDKEEYKKWSEEKKSKQAILEDEEEEEDESEVDNTDFEISVKTKNKEKAEKYLNELNEKFKSAKSKLGTSIYDKEALKKYFENDGEESKNFKSYFGEETYKEILKKLETTKK